MAKLAIRSYAFRAESYAVRRFSRRSSSSTIRCTYGLDRAALPAAIAPETDGVGESNGCYIPAFRNVTEPRGDFRGSYGIELGVPRAAPGERSSFWMFAFGEMLPRPENRVTLDPSQKDEWGIPALRVACRHSKNELRMACDEFQVLRELAGAAGFEIVRENARLCPPGSAIHEMGTARMGTDPKTSVLDPFNRCWDVKNVVVADGACFPSGGFQNPTLTMMALAVRACRALGERLRKGEP